MKIPGILLLLVTFVPIIGCRWVEDFIAEADDDKMTPQTHVVPGPDVFLDRKNDTVMEGRVSFVMDDKGRIVVNETERHLSQFNKRKRIEGQWPGGVIHYTINETDFTTKETMAIMAAMEEWSIYSCVKFSNESSKNFIAFETGERCHSEVGMVGGRQVIQLDTRCREKPFIMDQIGHAIGLSHTPKRRARSTKSDTKVKDKTSLTWPQLFFYDARAVNVFQDCQYYTSLGLRCELINSRCPGEGFVGKWCECWCPSKTGRDVYDLCAAG